MFQCELSVSSLLFPYYYITGRRMVENHYYALAVGTTQKKQIPKFLF